MLRNNVHRARNMGTYTNLVDDTMIDGQQLLLARHTACQVRLPGHDSGRVEGGGGISPTFMYLPTDQMRLLERCVRLRLSLGK